MTSAGALASTSSLDKQDQFVIGEDDDVSPELDSLPAYEESMGDPKPAVYEESEDTEKEERSELPVHYIQPHGEFHRLRATC